MAVVILPLIEIPAAPLAVNLLKALVPPTAPPNTIDPVPALTVSERGVLSLLTVPVNVTTPALEVTVWSPPKVSAPSNLTFPEVFIVGLYNKICELVSVILLELLVTVLPIPQVPPTCRPVPPDPVRLIAPLAE